MKKLLYIILATICLTSCGDDFLDTINKTQKNSANFPSTEVDMQTALNAVYASNIEVTGPPARWQIPFLISEIMADYTLSGGGLDDRHLRAMSVYKKNADNMFSELWRRYYRGIHRANFILENENKIKWSGEAARQKILGQAYFLRAQFYFDIARMFERVPLILSTKAQNLPQATPAELYKQILSDFKMASDMLPAVNFASASKAELGKATRWAAQGMLARAYLFYSGFYKTETVTLNDNTVLTKQAVATMLDDCIANSGHSLITDFRNLWPYAYSNKDYAYSKNNNLNWIGETGNNTETVFAFKFSTLGSANTLAYCNNMDLFFGLRGQEKLPFAKGWGWCAIVPKLYQEWPDNDIRKKGTIWNVNDASEGVTYQWNANRNYNETGYFNKKYMPVNVKNPADGKLINYSCVLYGVTPHFQYNNTQDMVILRFADILLMAAELGSVNAQDYLNRVRTRAGLPAVPVTIENIKKERLYELAFEGVRYYDLMRWGDVEAEVNRMQQNVPVKTLGVAQSFTSVFRATTNGFLPIPEDEIKLSNGVLKQNTGWDTSEAYYTE